VLIAQFLFLLECGQTNTDSPPRHTYTDTTDHPTHATATSSVGIYASVLKNNNIYKTLSF